MSAQARTGLYWLPEPSDWRGSLAAVGSGPLDDDAWDGLAALARQNLDLVQTIQLDRLTQGLSREGLAGRPVRLALLGSSTTTHLLPGIRVAALRRKLCLETYEPAFGQYRQELADDTSKLRTFAPDFVLLAFDACHVVRGLDIGAGREEADTHLGNALHDLTDFCRAIGDRASCRIIVQTALPVFPARLGNNEHRLPGSPRQAIADWNHRLRDLAEKEGFDLLATDARAAEDGLQSWHDPVLWNKAKQEISPLAAPVYGELVARLLAARLGRSSKCLVLDLDNTLWGGVIGDDGLEGIVLGPGSAMGEAFRAMQDYARDLGRQGIILAVCSKNDAATATAAFERHPEMALRMGDIAAFRANWDDKATNIRSIADELGIGLDSIVFVDDNPVERDFVRSRLPMVSVPEIPCDPALVPRALSDAGYFEGVVVTEEDRHRTEQYQANRARSRSASTATDMEGYLRDLDMKLVWAPFDKVNLQRVVQLINKTNQFNLTTLRCSEQDVVRFEEDRACLGLYFRLADRFGDNGIISVVMARESEDDEFVIENWLMSCRVLGRGVERAVLDVLVGEARLRALRTLVGRYVPTDRNGMVRDHYARLGFASRPTRHGEATDWSLDAGAYEPRAIPIEIIGRKPEWTSAQFTMA
jgi:FkbH-like protein